jgi:hypothetical protein
MVDTAVLGFLEAITGTGVSVAAFASTLAKTHGHHRAIASLVAESAIDEWCPFIDAGMPSGRWHDLADTVDRLREVGVAAQSYMFARALDEVLTGVLVEEAAALKRLTRGR